MENNNNDLNKEFDDIDEILKEFQRRKEQHISDFGELAPPEKSKWQIEDEEKQAEKKPGKQKKKKAKKGQLLEAIKSVNIRKPDFSDKKTRRAALIAGAAAIAVILIIGVITGITLSKTAYLRPYEKKYPDVNFPQGIRAEFCDLYAKNFNLAGSVSVPDCNYEALVSGKVGKVAFDEHCDTKDLDFNTVIYVDDPTADFEKAYGSMEAYLASGQKIELKTLYEDYEFNVIGAFYTNSNPEDDGGYCFPYNLTESLVGSNIDDYTDRLLHRFLYNTDYKITNESKLLTLCTKSDFMPDFRFVVVCALDASVQTAQTTVKNEKVRYPQIWYDVNGQKNPYRFASQWYPEIYIDKTEETSQQSVKDFKKF